MELFGFLRKRDLGDSYNQDALKNQIATDNSDGATTIEGYFNNFILNFDWTANNQAELIDKYREIANYNEVDSAIQDIVNEMVSFAEDEEPIKLNLDDTELSDNIKSKIQESWDKITYLLDLKNSIHQRSRNFYVDGRLAYQKVIDKNKMSSGLQDIIELDTKYVTKVRNVVTDEQTKTIKSIDEHFIYNEYNPLTEKTNKVNTATKATKEALKLPKESLVYVTSGLIDPKTGFAISWLNKAIKPANQLRMMENALVIYRVTRAPERRVFYIDVGNLPKGKGQEYLNNLKNSYKNKMSFDPTTGDFKDNRHLQTMQEDYWLPRSSSGKGTEVSTLSGGANLGDIEDVTYFLKRLYKSLNIPISRLESDSNVMFGRTQEINRDELKFSKFVSSIRKRFNLMFLDLLRTELVLTKVITAAEWKEIEHSIKFIYAQDLYLEERKAFEMMRDRLDLANEFKEYVGRYVSNKYIRANILQQTDEEQAEMDKEIAEEKTMEQYNPIDDQQNF
jgi:hypothetical protein